jgi:NADH dehydrogenase
MPDRDARVLVTGANGQIGLQLFERLAEAGIPARAVVRSRRAAERVEALPESIRPEIRTVDPSDGAALTEAARGCDRAVHLIGILKESSTASYETAHQGSCRALAEAGAALGLRRIVYVSIFGSHPESGNACLASKGRAEAILMASGCPVSVLRVPMVIGPDDPASRALRAVAQKKSVALIGGGRTIQQPLDSRDLLDAILACLADASDASEAFDLGGPEALPHRVLVERAAALYGNVPRIRTLPVGLIRFVALVMERLSSNPPITRAMLEVLEHDDEIDSRRAVEKLGLALRDLDDTLESNIGPEAPDDE